MLRRHALLLVVGGPAEGLVTGLTAPEVGDEPLVGAEPDDLRQEVRAGILEERCVHCSLLV